MASLEKHLILMPNSQTLLACWRIVDIVNVMHPFARLNHNQASSLEKLLGRMGISTIFDLWDEDSHSWRPLETRLGRIRGLPTWLRESALALLDAVQPIECPSFDLEVDPNLWEWIDRFPMARMFQVPNKKNIQLDAY